MANIYILGVVVSKLGYRQEPYLIILFKIDKGSRIGLYDAVLLLRLTVYLRMERSEKPLLNAEKVAKQ